MTATVEASACRTGESADLAWLYESHFEALVQCARRLLDTRVLAEEAVQEAFLRYHSTDAQPTGGAEFAYLRASVMNNARSMLRRRRCAEAWRPETPRYTPAIDDVCIARDAELRLHRLCQSLPDRQREVVVLRYWAGLTMAETADALGISVGSAKTHASRARASLRDMLEPSNVWH